MCSWWLLSLVSQNSNSSLLSTVRLSKFPLSFLGAFFLGFLASCPVQLQNSANVFKDEPSAGLSALLLVGILAIHASNFCLSFFFNFCLSIFKKLPNFLLVFLPLKAILPRLFAWIFSPVIPHLVLENVPRKRVAAEFWFASLWFSVFQDFPPHLLVISRTLLCL